MWKETEIKGYKFTFKIYDIGSIFGINDGRVSKLSIRKNGKELYNYDRGLDFNNLDEDGKEAFTIFLGIWNE